jgi:hypothetical protein
MPTRTTESTHEADVAQPLPPDDPQGTVESPSADRMQGANGKPPDPDADDGPSGDQDIDTAGTDADPESPTKAGGTGIARERSRG